jgi:hypothetical protein
VTLHAAVLTSCTTPRLLLHVNLLLLLLLLLLLGPPRHRLLRPLRVCL